MIEVEKQTTEVEVINNIEVTSTNQVEVETVDLSDLDITVAKKEYVITGDDIYIPMLYDDAPQWMKDLVQVVVDVSISSGNQSLINNMNAILQDFAVRYVPLNQYTQSILDLGDEDTRINALITTLNSNFSNGLSSANAQIIEMQLTKASKDEVVAQVIQTIAAQLADGASNIGSTIGRIDQAIADETSARALSLQTLTASLEDTNLDVTANAEVIQNALAYVGIDEAGASTGTGLSAYLEDSNGNIGGADSKLANSIKVTAEGVESKFAYNSLLNINGVYKKSGFGLTTNYVSGSGTQIDPYVSEFWIDASRLKFTNSAMTGRTAPFTIDASGTTPVITFNGKVSFTNVTDTTSLTNSISTAQSTANTANSNALARVLPSDVAAAINNNTTTINGGKITTGSITAAQINTTGLIAENISASEIVGKTITGGIINGAVLNGAVVKASYLDLDGELEVLTNYHITPAMYTANPSLYTDAVYISASNEYRIPSLSLISESTVNYQTSSTVTYYGVMSSYNTANIGNNLKAVKIRPSFSNQTPFIMINSTCSDEWFGASMSYGIKNHFRLKLGTITLLECIVTLNSYGGSNDTTTIQLSGSFFTTITHTIMSGYNNNDLNITNNLNIGIGTLSTNTIVSQGSWSDSESGYSGPNKIQLICTLQSGTLVFPSDWSSGRLSFQQVVVPQSDTSAVFNGVPSPINGLTQFKLNQSLYINNMI